MTVFADKLTLPENFESPTEQRLEPSALKLKQDAPIKTFMPPPDKTAPLDDTLEFMITMHCDTILPAAEM